MEKIKTQMGLLIGIYTYRRDIKLLNCHYGTKAASAHSELRVTLYPAAFVARKALAY